MVLPTFHEMDEEGFFKRNAANVAKIKISSTQYRTFTINTKPYRVTYKGFHYLVSASISTFILSFFSLIFHTPATVVCFHALNLFPLCFYITCLLCLETPTLPKLSEVHFKFYFLRYNPCVWPSYSLVCCE